MKSLNTPKLLALSIAFATAQAQAEQNIETMTIIGSQEELVTLPGSAGLVYESQLEQEIITDPNQALKSISGVYIREEDGFGLRPNIGIRAAEAERSSKVTVMEDGVLIAPAPYSNPAAYYFPTTLRMNSIEVLKGTSLLRYGPQTIAGVINLVSTPIPEENSGRALFMVNDRSSTDLLLNYGGKNGAFGYLLETVQRNYQGFKEIDRSEQDTGFDIQDYVAKLSWENERNLVLLKLQRSTENSRETYTGLTEADFNKNPNRRYGLTADENMDNKHTGFQLDHVFQWTNNLSSSTTIYHNAFERDWFKTGDSKSLINDANGGDAGDQAILDGINGSGDKASIKYKHNSREYISQGIQTNFNWVLGSHELDIGLRLHHDEMDRFQPTELMDQVNGSLTNRRPSSSAVSGSNNREETGDAIAFWLTDNFQVNDALALDFSLRVENIETERKQYSNTDRTGTVSIRSNKYTEVLLGAGATFDVSDQWQLLGSVHQGITPLGGGSQDGEEPESSDNLEFGGRFSHNGYQAEAILFYSDFSNKAELCSNASPCSNGSTSGASVIGGAETSGLELNFAKNFRSGETNFPVRISYTHTQAETTSKGGSTAGETLKDIPENTASLRAGIEQSNGWSNYMVISYIDSMCAKIGCNKSTGELKRTQDLATMDLISRFQLKAGPEAFVKITNVMDEQRVVARSPYGARPNMPRTISVGLDYRF